MQGLALCAGVGAMELGLSLALGEQYRTVGYVEREAYAAAVLVARMEDAALDRAPVWDDLCTFDGTPYRGKVDLVSSGLPCQPYSVAGRQRGHEDERALWPHFVRIIEECEPGLVFIENVPPFRKHSEPVWRHLRELGFVWAPPLLQTAAEAGAIHDRERFYALAAHPDRSRTDLHAAAGASRGAARQHDIASADADGGRCESLRGFWLFDRERQTYRHDADGCDPRCRICGTQWALESPVVRVDARAASHVDELRAIGNVGAPPVAYARAFLALLEALRLES